MSNSDIDDVLNENYYTSHSNYKLDKPLDDVDIDINQILDNNYSVYKANLKIAKELNLDSLDDAEIKEMTNTLLNYEYSDKKHEGSTDYDKLKSAYMSKVSQFNMLKENYVLTINNFMKLKQKKDFTETQIIPMLSKLETKYSPELIKELGEIIENRDKKINMLFAKIVNSQLEGNYKFKILTEILESLDK